MIGSKAAFLLSSTKIIFSLKNARLCFKLRYLTKSQVKIFYKYKELMWYFNLLDQLICFQGHLPTLWSRQLSCRKQQGQDNIWRLAAHPSPLWNQIVLPERQKWPLKLTAWTRKQIFDYKHDCLWLKDGLSQHYVQLILSPEWWMLIAVWAVDFLKTK